VLSAAESGALLNNIERWVASLIVSTEPAAPLREAEDPCSAATGNDQSALEKRRASSDEACGSSSSGPSFLTLPTLLLTGHTRCIRVNSPARLAVTTHDTRHHQAPHGSNLNAG
jgi:hypothetical protein